MPALCKACIDYNNYDLITTGHSLGAGLSATLAILLRETTERYKK